MSLGSAYLGPAVVFAEQDVSGIEAGAIAPSVTAVIAYREAGGVELCLLDGATGRGKKIDLLSLEICAAVAASTAGEELLRGLAEKIHAIPGGGENFPQITRVSPEADFATQAAVAVQQGLARLLGALATRNASLARALAAVRREHEVLQDAAAFLEEVVQAGNLPEKPAFTLMPTDRVLSVRDNLPATDAVTQRIPVSSRGISSIDLCFFVADESGKGHFDVALESLEDGVEAGAWRVPFQRIGAGWTRLQLDEALMGPPRTLQLVVKASVVEGAAPDLVLAAPSPLDDAVYQTTGGQKGDCPLAFRVWRSLPGLRSRIAVGAIRTAGRDADPSSLRHLPASQLSSAEPIGRGAPKAAELVQYFQDHGELQVHPAARGLVSAYLRGAIPPFTGKVSASVITRHPEADVLDYAILAIQGRDAVEAALGRIAAANEPADGFSGWHAVPPMEHSRISLSFAKPPRTALDLLLVTRVHESGLTVGLVWRNLLQGRWGRGHTRYAWARFFDVEVELAQQ